MFNVRLIFDGEEFFFTDVVAVTQLGEIVSLVFKDKTVRLYYFKYVELLEVDN